MMGVVKWGLIALFIVAVAGAIFTRKTFHVETVVTATPSEVWAVLTDTAAYSEWNPVFVAVDGPYVEGGSITNKVKDPGGNILEMTSEVRALRPEREIRQYGGIPGFITFDHQWLLEPVPEGTRIVQREVDRGIYLWIWNSDWIEPAYQSVLSALEKRLASN